MAQRHEEDTDDELVIPPDTISNNQLFVLLVRMNSKLSAQNVEIASLRRTSAEQGEKITTLVNDWNTATGVVRFLKIMGGVATAILAVWGVVEIIKHAIGLK